MHLHFERIEKPNSYSDCNILSLSWMGKVPDGLLQTHDEEGWKLNRTNYYQDGWIALGNGRGIVGVTYTTCRCRKTDPSELPSRTNYNLRGHRSEVTLVKWNEPYQKLASCDSSGIIFVWIKYEGRWSVELINDRSTQVTDFSWSHDGRMALICYVDGFVLIGSVAGQRYWSSMLNLDSCSTTCGIWTPDDHHVIFGTSNGSILVIDINGTIVAQTSVRDGHNIRSMAWSSEKFKMEDSEDDGSSNFNNTGNRSHILSICFDDGVLYLLRNYDDILPIIIRTNLIALKMEWSNKGEVLAVGGHQIVQPSNRSTQKNQFSTHQQPEASPSYMNQIHFYTESGCLRYKVTLDYTHHPICSLTWGHNDKRLFVGTGPVLHIAWITKRIASLQLLCRLTIQKKLALEHDAFQLPVPNSLQNLVASLFGRTLRCYLPDSSNLTKFVVNPPVGNTRLYCTLIRHDNDNIVGESSSSSYVLYLEYLGGLVPILKGKRTSKLRPEFVIYDPELKSGHLEDYPSNSSNNGNIGSRSNNSSKLISSTYYWNSSSTPGTSDSESEMDPVSNSSSYQHSAMRIRRRRRSRRNREREANNNMEANVFNGQLITNFKPESTYTDEMPESQRLTLITSNIWGTKFKVLGLVPWLPACLGSIAYRTSLLHLQPRQMTLKIKELGGPRRLSESENISSYVNRNGLMVATSSEDEDESGITNDTYRDESYCVPIAPMTPRRTFRYHYPLNSASQSENISNQSATSSASSSYFFHNSNGNNSIQYHNQLESNHHLHHDHPYNLNSSSTQFQSGLIDSNGQDYINLISHLNEDLLTLQLSTTESSNQLISMELTSVGPEDIGQNVENNVDPSNTSKAPASSSVSTQTSFQSLSDLRDIRNQPKEGLQNNQTNVQSSTAESSQLMVPISMDQLKTESQSSQWPGCTLNQNSQNKLPSEHPITSTSCQPSLINIKSEIISSFSTLSTSIDNNSNQLPSSISIDSGTCRSGMNLSPFSPLRRGYTSPSHHRNHRNQRSLREKPTGYEIKPIKNSCHGSLERSFTVNGSIRPPPSLKLYDQNRRSFRSSHHHRSPIAINSMVTSPTATVQRNQSTTPTSSSVQHPTCSSSSSFSSLPLQYSPGFSTSSTPLLSNGQIDGLSGSSCVYSVARYQPYSASSGQHDIKYIDEQEIDDITNDPNLVVGRSPSFLFCRNRSSIAQYNHRSPHHHQHQQSYHNNHSNNNNNTDHNSSYGSSSTTDFTCLRANIETQNFVQHTSHQRRYTLSTSRSSGANSIAGRTTPDHHPPSSGHSTLTRNGKERHRNCMSLDEDEDESEESIKGVPSSSTFCKCDEETESSSSMSENCTSKSFLNTGRPCSDHRKRDDAGSCGSDYDLNQPLLTPSAIQNRQKLLSFDCDEILNSLNEGNHLLRDNSLVITQPPPSIGSVFSRSSSRIVNSESGNYIGQHRGSLGLPVMGSDAINLAKNFRNDFVNRSLPASPLSEKKNKRKAEGKSIFYSPTMFRKAMKQKLNYFDCSSDDDNGSEDDLWSNDFKNLGSFQRSTIRRHIKVKRRSSRIQPDSHNMNHSRHHAGREFLLHNKAPLWNEVNQVYQLDFGGRVTQESAKNFQIEHQGKQVMQFGRIDDNAYTLDFQYPFSALQALGVALANVTQRLK